MYHADKLQAQNWVKSVFEVKCVLEGQDRSPHKTIKVLTEVFYISWLTDTHTQTDGWTDKTDRQTDTQLTTVPKDQKWAWVKMNISEKDIWAHLLINVQWLCKSITLGICLFDTIIHRLPCKRNKHLLIMLTYWDRLTPICASTLTDIGSDNGLSPGRSQAIIWTNAGIHVCLIWNLGTNFSEILSGICTLSLKKMHF